MDFITLEQARQDIVALRLPQLILDAFDDKPLPYNLDFQFRQPYQMFALAPDGQAAYSDGRITPIWTNCSGYTIVAYRHAPASKGFFRFDIESPGEEYQPSGLNWQQVLVAEFKFLWEMERSDDQLREVAGWLGFNCIEMLLAELPQANQMNLEQEAVWYRSFLDRIKD